jgi:indolepyruvate ferredoxin oxidoreductase beta subunit
MPVASCSDEGAVMGGGGHRGLDKPISLAILAIGGQGGGVLCDWIVAVAEAQGWVAQSTSVPGVAQRTGATVYYIEMLPAQSGRDPVLSLMPTPGDVDVVMAAEFMEAGRSMLRGLVTPDRTTLIASTHRSFAIAEKERPGDGTANPVTVVEATGVAAKRTIVFDMQKLAEQNGSVISAAMFGALAGAAVLPFPRAAFETAVRAGGKGVTSSLKAFGAAFDQVNNPPPVIKADPVKTLEEPPLAVGKPALDRLLQRLRKEFPVGTRAMLFAGIKHLVDYQDVRYADEYLDHVAAVYRLDERLGGQARGFALTQAAAKYVGAAMAYDDVIRVADLKTRTSRFARIDAEVGKRADQVLYMTEFMHPRMEEVAGTLPVRLGKWIEARPALFRWLDKMVSRGRRVRTGTIMWFQSLYLVSSMKPLRRKLLRHEREVDHLERWLAVATGAAERDYDLAVEVFGCRRLVKGYSDTYARGASKFDRLIAAVPYLIGKPDSAGWLRRLRLAALADEEGKTLDGALNTLRSAFETENSDTQAVSRAASV